MSAQIKKRFYLSKGDSKKLNEQLKINNIKLDLSDRIIEYIELKSGEIIYLIDKKPEIIKINNKMMPFLTSKLILQLPRLYVDQGAVPHIINGADVMAPGITKIVGELKEGMLAVVVDQLNNRPLAVVEILDNWSQLIKDKHGKVARNLHHLNDKIWRVVAELLR
ncbi:MAG: DUF1947 domain-containing protein [Thermoprotei archaeon]|jgi:PUA domain protein